MVYFSSDDGYLFAVNAENGRLAWKLDMGRPVAPRKPIPESWDDMQSSPAVADGRFIQGHPTRIFTPWMPGPVRSSGKPRSVCMCAPLRQWWMGSYILEIGRAAFMRWMRNWIDQMDLQHIWPGHPFADRGGWDHLYRQQISLPVRHRCVAGEQKWCFKYPANIPWVELSAALADGVVYVGSSDWDKVNAINASTGELKWDFTTKGDP